MYGRHVRATVGPSGFEIETLNQRALSPSQASANTSYVAFTRREPSLDLAKSKALIGVISTTKVGVSVLLTQALAHPSIAVPRPTRAVIVHKEGDPRSLPSAQEKGGFHGRARAK